MGQGENPILDTEEFEAGGARKVYGSICQRLEEELHEVHAYAYSHIGCEV